MAGLEGAQLGSCRILHRIGGGGMGDVYLADQPGLGRQVAVKVVRDESLPVANDAAKEQAHQQFLQEAQAIATLDHPNILPVYEYGDADGIHYLVMPHIPSGSLADLLLTGTRPGGEAFALPLAPAMVISVVSQTAEALQYAHDHGVIHRDVKPQNLLVRFLRSPGPASSTPLTATYVSGTTAAPGPSAPAPTLQILLADFGLARFMSLLVGRTGTVGTPLYSAPEQYSGYPVPATDQYALAGIAYLLLTGHYVFNGTVVELHHQHLSVAPTPPTRINAALPPAVDTMLMRALAKDPAQRFPSVREFAQGLQSALSGASAHPAWPRSMPAAPPQPPAQPTPITASSLLMPTPQAPGGMYGPAGQGMEGAYGAFGMGDMSPAASAPPLSAVPPAVDTPPAPMTPPAPTASPSPQAPYIPFDARMPPYAGTPSVPWAPPAAEPAYGPAPVYSPPASTPASAPIDAAALLQGASPSLSRPFVPTTPRSPAPPPSLTPSGPWRLDADAPGAPLPRRPTATRASLRNTPPLTRKVLLIGIVAVLVLASLSGLAIHFLGKQGAGTSGVAGTTVLAGGSGVTGKSLKLVRGGTVTISNLTPLNGGIPTAESASSSRLDQADARIAHITGLSPEAPTISGFVGSGSPGANQQVAVPRLVLAGASQTDVGVKAPLDTSVGANAQYAVEALDGLLHFASLSGTPNSTRNVSAAAVFASVLHTSDLLQAPRVLYDAAAGRWLVAYDEVADVSDAPNASYIDLAVSSSSSPLAGWNVYQVPTAVATYGACTWGDYPQLGANADSYFLTVSLFACGARGKFLATVAWEAPKSALEAGTAATVYQWTGFDNDTQRPVFSLAPAVETDASTTEWLVSNDAGYVDGGGTSSALYVWAIVPEPPTANGPRTITVARQSIQLAHRYADPPAAAQRGTSVLLAAGDARISSLIYAGGHLYTAFATAVNWQGDSRTRSAIYWLDLGPTLHTSGSVSKPPTLTVGVIQSELWGFAGGYTMFPALVADQQGTVVLAATASSPGMDISLILGSRKKSDPAGVLAQGRPAQILQSGSKAFIAGQWGDYSGACLLEASSAQRETAWFAGVYTDASKAFWRSGIWELSIG